MDSNLKTEEEIISQLRTTLENEMKNCISRAKEVKDEKNSLLESNARAQLLEQKDIEMRLLKSKYQVYLYVFAMIKTCKSFNFLREVIKSISATGINMAKKYNQSRQNYITMIPNSTTLEINNMKLSLEEDFARLGVLREIMGNVTITLNTKAKKVEVKQKEKPRVENDVKSDSSPRIVPIQTQDKVSKPLTSDDIRKLDTINKQVYRIKLEFNKLAEKYNMDVELAEKEYRLAETSDEKEKAKVKLDLVTGKRDTLVKKLYNLVKIRELAVSELALGESGHELLVDVERYEDICIRNSRNSVSLPFTITEENLESTLEKLNSTISDLKINKGKSKIFHEMHSEDRKLDPNTLSKDISRLSSERTNIVKAIMGSDDEALKTDEEVSALEFAYNLEGGYQTFRKVHKNSKLTGIEPSKNMFKEGQSKLIGLQGDLLNMLREKMQGRGSVVVKPGEDIFDSSKEKLDLYYQRLFATIQNIRINKSQKEQRENNIESHSL